MVNDNRNDRNGARNANDGSDSLWTRCDGTAQIRALMTTAFRVVESQTQLAMAHITDSSDEQDSLEALLDQQKPRLPSAARGRHYLIATPFRYPPLRHGSRFSTRPLRGIFYASEHVRTALAEAAYYRLVFLAGMHSAPPNPLRSAHTVFAVKIYARRGIDFTAAPFDRARDAISDPESYVVSQALGREMRKSMVEAFRFFSARDAAADARNLGVFEPSAIASRKPRDLQAWDCTATAGRVSFVQAVVAQGPQQRLDYPAAQFLINGRLPLPSLA